MRNKKVKDFWLKIKERYSSIDKANERMGILRTYKSNEISHVRLQKSKNEFFIEYSIARWFKNECDNAGIKI